MSEWQRVKFEDLLVGKKISYGVVQPGQFQEVGGVPLIRVNNIKNAKVDVSDIVKIHGDVEAKYSKTRLSGGELLITVVGSVGECAIVTEELKGFNVARAVSVANIVDGVDKRFVAYQFRTEDLKFQMYGNTNDTVQPTLNLTELKQLSFTLPPLSEQKAIASVLSSLDDKIDLLHRQNKTLEAMAETLFRQWFIEEAKEGWPVKPLKEICQIINGFAFKSGSYTDSGYKVIRTLNFTNHKLDTNQLVYVSEDTAKEYEKYNLQRKDFLLVMVGASLGNYAIVTKDALPALQNQNMWCFRAFDDCYQNFLNHRLLDVIEENLSGASGSAREFFQKSVFYEVTIAVPPNELLEAYNLEADALFNKMEFNRDQIQTLENLRDTLLPKLMSGEVRVQYQTEEVA